MSSIQEIRELEQRIYDIVQDYVDGKYNNGDVLSISSQNDNVILNADAKEDVTVDTDAEIYPLKELVRDGDDGGIEPDIDKISDVANSCCFWIDSSNYKTISHLSLF